MKRTIINLVGLHKTRISGAARYDKLKILSYRSAPTAKKSKIFSLCPPIAVFYTALNVICIVSSNVSALSYSDNIGVNFTFNTSLTVSLSSADLVINDLTPGTSDDSNIVDINVETNNLNGYYLSSTVGNSTDTTPSHNTTSLVHSNNSNTFISLSTSDNVTSLDDLDNNTWGYSYSTDNRSTWSSYSGLPLYTSTGTTLSEKYTPSNDTINFKIAAKASTTQPAGEYTNVINFTITAYPSPMSLADSYAYFNKQQTDGYYTMQDMEPGVCALAEEESELQVKDSRDGEVYYIGKLKDGRCWLLDNLRLDPTITELSESDTNAPQAALDLYQHGGTTTESGWSGEKVVNMTANFIKREEPRINNAYKNELSSDTTDQERNYRMGIYYNFCAATAGTYCLEYNTIGDAAYDVCPRNWRMPSGGGSGEYVIMNSLYGTYSEYRNSLHLPLSGVIAGSMPSTQGARGNFWSKTRATNAYMFLLQINTDRISAVLSGYGNDGGLSIRCIANKE